MRLFVALDLPEETRGAILETMRILQPIFAAALGANGGSNSIRWYRPEGMHVTLKFIGHVGDPADPEDERRIASSICASLAAVHSSQPIEMSLRGIGFFPDVRRPRVMWCGVDASANFATLAADIERALPRFAAPGIQGIEADEKPHTPQIVPHITLARFKSPDRRGRRLDGHAAKNLLCAAEEINSKSFGPSAALWRTAEFHLFESFLKPSGAEYRRVQTFPFVERTA